MVKVLLYQLMFVAREHSHPPSHNIRKRKKKENKEQKTENTSPQGQQGNKATSDNKRNFISKIEVLRRSPMFQNPGFIQTNKQANKLTNKLPRPMWIAVGSSKGNIVLGIDNNFGSRFVSGILNAPNNRNRSFPLDKEPHST